MVPQILQAMEKKGITYRTSEGRVRGVSRIAHHTMGAEERVELIGNMVETSHFAVMFLGEFSGAEFNKCEVVMQIYPMTAAKKDVAPWLWSVVYNSTSLCFSESGKKFALQVGSKYKVRLGLYSECDAAARAAASLPEINGSWLLVKNEKTNQLLEEDWTLDIGHCVLCRLQRMRMDIITNSTWTECRRLWNSPSRPKGHR